MWRFSGLQYIKGHIVLLPLSLLCQICYPACHVSFSLLIATLRCAPVDGPFSRRPGDKVPQLTGEGMKYGNKTICDKDSMILVGIEMLLVREVCDCDQSES